MILSKILQDPEYDLDDVSHDDDDDDDDVSHDDVSHF